MMVLPVQGLPGGKKSKRSKKKGAGGPGDVQVNLIVDPTLFGGRDRDEENDEEDEYGSGSDMPGLYTSLSSPSGKRRGKHRRGAKRRGIFEGLAIEAQWKRARKFLKWCMAADVVCLVLWGAEFVFIMMGKRCIPGAFNGW